MSDMGYDDSSPDETDEEIEGAEESEGASDSAARVIRVSNLTIHSAGHLWYWQTGSNGEPCGDQWWKYKPKDNDSHQFVDRCPDTNIRIFELVLH